jgi:hypothetical protein
MRYEPHTGTIIPAAPGWDLVLLAATQNSADGKNQLLLHPIIAWDIARRAGERRDGEDFVAHELVPIAFNCNVKHVGGVWGIKEPDGKFRIGDATVESEADAIEELKLMRQDREMLSGKRCHPPATEVTSDDFDHPDELLNAAARLSLRLSQRCDWIEGCEAKDDNDHAPGSLAPSTEEKPELAEFIGVAVMSYSRAINTSAAKNAAPFKAGLSLGRSRSRCRAWRVS